MTDAAPIYEVFAIHYARRDARRSEHFIGGDPHDGPMPMDYFVWLIRGPDGAVVVDLGFTAEMALQRKREFLRCPVDALRLLDVDPDTVRDVVLTHLHYDHVGNLHRFPAAQFHLQEPDLHFAVGRHMRHAHLRQAFEVEDVVGIVRANYAGRVHLYNGAATLRPGITLHPAPGHSAGLQFVRVNTSRGPVVLASDVSHFTRTWSRGARFPSASAWRICWRATTASAPPLRRRRISCPVTIRSSWSATPRRVPTLPASRSASTSHLSNDIPTHRTCNRARDGRHPGRSAAESRDHAHDRGAVRGTSSGLIRSHSPTRVRASPGMTVEEAG